MIYRDVPIIVRKVKGIGWIVKASYVGEDDWGRQTIITKKDKTILKDVDGRWYRVTPEGEPDTPIGKDIKIVVIE